MAEQDALFAEYRRTGDIAIRNQIAEKYLYIAQILAKKFAGRGVEYDDLYQVASLALLKGIDRFDYTLGMQFATFITPTITGEIKNYFRDKSRIIKVPRRLSLLAVSARAKSAEILAQTGKKPSIAELAAALNESEENVIRAMEVGGTVSLDAAVKNSEDDKDTALYELIPDQNDSFDSLEQTESLRAALSTLTDTEKLLVKYRYHDELSQSETAKRLNVSQMFVSRLERKVLEKLRSVLKEG